MSSTGNPDEACSLGEEVSGKCELDANLEVLRLQPAFAEIPLPRLKLYAYLAKRVHYQAGEFLFHQGDLDDRGYIVLSGKATVSRDYRDHSVHLNELHEGEFFGGIALLADVKRLFTVQAITALECLTLDRASFRKLLIQFPETALKVLEVMVRRIVHMEEQLLGKELHECIYS